MFLRGAVEPGRRRRVLYPGMVRTCVVGNFVLNDFDAELMSAIDQLAQLCECTKVFFNSVEIYRAITMIVRDLSLRTVRLIRILLVFIQMIYVFVPPLHPDPCHP